MIFSRYDESEEGGGYEVEHGVTRARRPVRGSGKSIL